MPFRKRRFFRALLMGALSFGPLSALKASDADSAQPENARRFVRFHHDVYLREPRSFQETPALPPGGAQLSLQPTSFTPYDPYMGNVRSVISHLEPRGASMALACRLMLEGRSFHYMHSDPYFATPPALTATERAGDCKAKALWLYHELGDANALFVIGKASKRSRNSHAWVYWRNENRWWILDCTNRSEPIAADSVAWDCYVPYYSFGRAGAYRHKATFLPINPISPASGTPIVADHSTSLHSVR